jgi:TonB-dependent SusC/RagA subfamily outer membrane receptor
MFQHRKTRGRPTASLALSMLFGLLALATPLAAQNGTVTGVVTNTATLRPIIGLQVSMEGGLGTLTGSAGRFILLNVPPGSITVEFTMIGFARETRTVTLVAGQTVELNVELTERAIALDEIVVTGSASATERRTIGNAVATVNAAELTAVMPITSVDELILGRSAGVQMDLGSGGGNFGGQIRIRGLKSASIRGDPAIYIDGVRVDGQHDRDSQVRIGGQTISRILDLQASDIERVEIIKGAAAASLYGTQGSNGVIQIFTKKGSTGPPQWTFEVEQGFERVPADTFPGRLNTQFVGPDGFRARDPMEVIESGYRSRYMASVSGGSGNTKYYISGGYKQQEGSIAPITNWLKQVQARVNITTLLGDNVTVTATTGFTHSRLRVPDNDNALHGTYSQFASAIPYTANEDRPYGERFGSFTANQTVENHQTVLRNTTGIAVEHRISDAFSHRLNAGIDWYNDDFNKYFPFAYEGSGNKLGNKRNDNRTYRDVTLDYRVQLENNLSDNLSSSFVVGLQGDFRNTIRIFAFGTDFPAPGVRSVDATATTRAGERRIEEVNAGIFFHEMVRLWDKVYVTGGLRIDGNSAFGNEFNAEVYPKASIAYNISDESFWPASISTMKLRFAYGESGLAPAQFAADRTYIPIAAQDGVAAVTPGNVGNADLGPEKSKEFEVGFDAGLFDDRIGLEVTGYLQKTANALLEVPFPPSQGFLREQLTNIGEIQNRGIEIGVNALLVQQQNVEWSANVQYTATKNEVTDLGGVPAFNIRGARVAEGFPVNGQWGYELKSWNPGTRLHVRSDTLVYFGPSNPTSFGSLSSDIRYGNFTLRGMLEFTAGTFRRNFDRYWSIRVRTGDDYLSLLTDERGTATPAADSLRNRAVTLGSGSFTEGAGFTSLRELAVSYDLPESLAARVGLSNSSIRISGRNLFLWSSYSGISPETKRRDNVLGNNSSFDTQPVSRVFMVTFRTSM